MAQYLHGIYSQFIEVVGLISTLAQIDSVSNENYKILFNAYYNLHF